MTTDLIELTIERPAAGGRMLARHQGVVVLVANAIPGERVRARVERSGRGLLWARAVEIVETSAHRREPRGEPSCGALVYAHIEYAAQPALKGEVVVDALRRLGKMTIAEPVAVEASPEIGYRWRARLHVRNRHAGLFREGTHALCDAAASGQMLPETSTAIDALIAQLGAHADACDAMTVAENIDASARVVHLEPRQGTRLRVEPMSPLPDGITGVTAGRGQRVSLLGGAPRVTDVAADLFIDAPPPVPADTAWTRGAASFFQGNRYLTGRLVRDVIGRMAGARVVDLYAGVGLFAIAMAAHGASVITVEGDPISLDDLLLNAAPFGDRVRLVAASVEDAVSGAVLQGADAILVDPPRTGISAEAMAGLLRLSPPRLVYVSCDPATLARDAARLVAGGFQLASLRGFDLFPNTAHVETVAEFTRP